jgi:2-polyprenyl-3-methyl-5-hydroxy-6-metoxy-1,4-benzoquinol methylase
MTGHLDAINRMKKSTSDYLVENYHTLSRRADLSSPVVRKTVFRFFERAFLKLLPPDRDARIIDVGCGEGAFLLFLQAQGYTNICGVDLSPENVAMCAKSGLSVSLGDVTARNWTENGSYDAIVALDLIEHIPKSEAGPFLMQLRLALNRGGRLILQTPNMGSLFASAIRFADLSHEFGVTEKSAVDLLMIAGFRLNEIEVLPSWNATTPLGFLREKYLSVLHRLLSLAEDSGRARIPTKNLIIVARRES